MTDNADTFEGWVILELMGHRRLAGYLREQEIAGSSFLRIDIPAPDGDATQLYSAAAVYCITPTSEETARQVAALARPAPVQRWELPAAATVVVDDEGTGCGSCGAPDTVPCDDDCPERYAP